MQSERYSSFLAIDRSLYRAVVYNQTLNDSPGSEVSDQSFYRERPITGLFRPREIRHLTSEMPGSGYSAIRNISKSFGTGFGAGPDV
jgi:hypothetical protein